MERSTKIKIGCGIGSIIALIAGVLKVRNTPRQAAVTDITDGEPSVVHAPPLGPAPKPAKKQQVQSEKTRSKNAKRKSKRYRGKNGKRRRK